VPSVAVDIVGAVAEGRVVIIAVLGYEYTVTVVVFSDRTKGGVRVVAVVVG
jgi:hypothetical protein